MSTIGKIKPSKKDFLLIMIPQGNDCLRISGTFSALGLSTNPIAEEVRWWSPKIYFLSFLVLGARFD
jgi:hypothetical protein